MKKIKKIKIKINGKIKSINQVSTLFVVLKNLKIPLNKVAIELNEEIIDKKKINKIKLNKDDKIEIVHFIGGG
jgi:thiamine biosynthesis protein ThiS